MAGYTTEGIILKRINFGEADKILTFFSKHFGKIRLLAKGIRKTKSRKGGNLELFNWVRIFVAKGRNLDLVTEVEVIKSFQNWRKDLKRVALAYHFVELVDRLTAEEAKSREVFQLLLDSLERLGTDFDLEALRDEFERKLLEELGFWPRGKTADKFDFNAYIEKLIEKRLNSRRVFREING